MAKRKKRSATNRSTLEPHWRTIEKVVALLEKSLAPDSRVRHNVKLPCLTTGHDEQCDVVIEIGQEPRVTRTIVEVQKRGERVKPNDFRGWCQKMRDVGAHRLICVSAKQFPQSIKDKVVKELGPIVLLVRLEALQTNQWPFQIVNNAMRVYVPEVSVDSRVQPNPLLVFNPSQNPFQEYIGQLFNVASLPNVIQRDESAELLPMSDLINEGVRRMNDHSGLFTLPEGEHQIRTDWTPTGASLCFNGKTARIKEVKATFIIKIQVTTFPFELSSYTQEGHDTLAWIARAAGKINGQDTEFRFAFKPNADGGFYLTGVQHCGFKDGTLVLWRYGDKLECQPSPSDASVGIDAESDVD